MQLVSWATLGAPLPFDPRAKFVSSPLLSPTALAAVRILLALYALATICTVLAFDVAAGDGKSFLSYFTELSYIGLTSYYCAAAVQSFFYARYGGMRGYRYPLQRWPRALQVLHVLLQATITTFPIIVTVVFWALLSSPETFGTRFSSWSNLSLHALNTLFALVEITLTNALPAPWRLLPLLIVLLGGYLGVAYVTRREQGFYTYPFLNPAPHPALLAAYIIGIGAGACVVFSLVRGVVVLRERVAGRFGRIGRIEGIEGAEDAVERGGGGDGAGGEALDEWEEVQGPVAASAKPVVEKPVVGKTEQREERGGERRPMDQDSDSAVAV
ncbi:hypothetical protein DFH06DRAFT_378554 [Mycena polygramma]|nr:hypothetical protein DFH06DRAFT_378554 [Mycena polygramma]